MSSHPRQRSRPSRSSLSTGGGVVTPGGGRLWAPAPQPSVSVDALTPFAVVSGVLAACQWTYLVGASAPDTAVLASASFAGFLAACLLALGAAARLSAEFGREFAGYNIPHARRSFVWHRGVTVATVSFYIGAACMVATAVLSLATSRRLLSGLILGVVGGGTTVGAALGTWHMLTHPLGVDTSDRFTGGPAVGVGAGGGGDGEGAEGWTGVPFPPDPTAPGKGTAVTLPQASPQWLRRETPILATAAPGGRRSQSLAATPRFVRFEAVQAEVPPPAGSPTRLATPGAVQASVGSVRSGAQAHVPPPSLAIPVPTPGEG